MKKTLHSLILLLALLCGSCTEENLLSPEPQAEEVEVRFRVNIPAYRLERTRSSSIDENAISSLSLLLFNEEGNFIKRVEANISTAGSFTATLPQSTERRIIHFVANHVWPATFDTRAAGKNEGELIPALFIDNEMRMWAREELSGGISASTFATDTVELIRNMAKISVENQAISSFTLDGFYLYRAPSIGTVAPFDATAYLFTEETLTEPAESTYSLESGLLSPSASWYLYERQNGQHNNADYLFAILQGTYSGATHYYKIDLLDGNRARCDILRNHHYTIKVKNVMKPGYASLAAAVAGEPSNGSLEVSVSQSPIISDGISRLEVDQTLFLFTRNGSSLDVGFRYYADMQSSTFNNSGVTVELIEDDPLNPVVDGTLSVVNPATDNGLGRITAAIHDVPSDNSTRTAHITVRKDDLIRTIHLVMHSAFSFEPVKINGDNIAPLTGQGTDAALSFTIPADYPSELFPLEVRVKTQGLTPAQAGLRLEVVDSEISYVYNATTPGTKTLAFKTAYPTYYEVVQVDATGFATGTTGYNVTETTGDIYFTDGSTTLPVPHAGSVDLTTSVGYISVPVNDGKYVWLAPSGTIGTTPVEVFFRQRVTQTLTKRYTKQVTAAGLSNNSTITLEHTENIARSSITYGISNIPVPSDAALTVSPSAVPFTMAAEGTYEYRYDAGANDAGTVTLAHGVQSSGRITDYYAKTVSYSDLRAGNPVQLEHVYTKARGTVTYSSTYSPVPEGSSITYTPAFPTGFSFAILPYSEYELTIPAGATTANDNDVYRFSFYYNYATYVAAVTLLQLREGDRIHLNNSSGKDLVSFGFITYGNVSNPQPILKADIDAGDATLSLSNVENPMTVVIEITSDGYYKLSINQAANDQKSFTLTYKHTDNTTYSKTFTVADIRASSAIHL